MQQYFGSEKTSPLQTFSNKKKPYRRWQSPHTNARIFTKIFGLFPKYIKFWADIRLSTDHTESLRARALSWCAQAVLENGSNFNSPATYLSHLIKAQKWPRSCIVGKNGGLMFVPTVSQAGAAVGSVCPHYTKHYTLTIDTIDTIHTLNQRQHYTVYKVWSDSKSSNWFPVCIMDGVFMHFLCYCPCSLSPSGQPAVLLIPTCLFFFSACSTKLTLQGIAILRWLTQLVAQHWSANVKIHSVCFATKIQGFSKKRGSFLRLAPLL